MDNPVLALFSGARRPILSFEVNPPKGVELAAVWERLDRADIASRIDFLNVTDCALAKMRLAALPFAALLKQRYGLEPLVNVSCRDRNIIALQSDLLAAWALGVRSVVALTGDAVTVGDNPTAKGVFEVNSVGLLKLIAQLGNGLDLSGAALSGAPDFFSGVVVNPNVRNPAAEVKKLLRKKEAGAKYALSQPVYDAVSAGEFFTQAASVGIPILVGLLPLKTPRAVKSISNVPGIRIPQELLTRLDFPDDADVSEFFLSHCVELALALRDTVAGFHVVSGATPRLGLQLIQELAKLRGEGTL
ncbi:MAG: methylenetetrahydrofolate reductase [Bdellovibrionota bacterium]|nr:MAG: methylenetetrahydrofolate reductase [Bdellovibrionota bacterium]